MSSEAQAPLPDDFAISIRNLTKTYRLFAHPGDRIKHFFSLGLKRYHQEFTALSDISFNIKKGETVGIIGRNGSGKSTLLQLICGILKPTSGNVQVNGRISALLELGAGFNPEFTGRENVYFQGALMGLTQAQMEERFDDIAAFADIGEFINQPVRTYSSGMFVRLAFSVVAHVDASILIIDEALAVGDIFFQQKCMRFLKNFHKDGGTIIFVSHDTSAIMGLCSKALMLPFSDEKTCIVGDAEEVCQHYIQEEYRYRSQAMKFNSNITSAEAITPPLPAYVFSGIKKTIIGRESSKNIITPSHFRSDAKFFGCGGAAIQDAWFEDRFGTKLTSIHGGHPVVFCVAVIFFSDVQWPAIGFSIKNTLGQYIFSESTDLPFRDKGFTCTKGSTSLVRYSFLMPILRCGLYSINTAVADGIGDNHIQLHWIEDAMTLNSTGSELTNGICGLQNLSISIDVYASSNGQRP